jgi:ubiquinone/menaquinone biosynthesis C-methylase UbiE
VSLDVRLKQLRCPVSGERLHRSGNFLVSPSGGRRYPIAKCGIPLFAEAFCSADGRAQQEHYDRVAAGYLENLLYPHTQEYTAYLDEAFFEMLGDAPLGELAELCCGRGEAFELLAERSPSGIGVDVSVAMLEAAVAGQPEGSRALFVQGDATMLPLADEAFDTVVMLGGIHHVGDREALFGEVARILRPGGRFLWREPVSDFPLWRWIRAVIYRFSPALDHETERPLLRTEVEAPLESARLELRDWKTYGFFGFCVLMNSDVLVFNRLFRFVPGIRKLARTAARIDDWTLKLPGLAGAGLQVVGCAEKPKLPADEADDESPLE